MKFKLPFSLEALKKIDKTHLLIAALVGVLLIVIVIPVTEPIDSSSEQEKDPNQETDPAYYNTSSNETNTEKEAYQTALEKKLKDILQSMAGVGRVEVMITLKDMGEAVVEKDFTRSEEQTSETGPEGVERENQITNTQEATVYDESNGSGSTPFVSREVNPQVEGVVVVAEGGQNSVIVKNISDAVLALFAVEPHKIKVVKLN
jgi:stage III sporulation protein AG